MFFKAIPETHQHSAQNVLSEYEVYLQIILCVEEWIGLHVRLVWSLQDGYLLDRLKTTLIVETL